MKSEIPDQVSPTKNNNLLNLDNSKDIFIVHGHNNEVKIDVARLLEKLGLNPIILHEQANEGKTIIEKFEAHSKVGFAIILLTDDDLGKNKNDLDLIIRARQNVILEMGYFIGKLGRNRVCPLYITGVELPSDLYGLLYVEIDNQENWKFKLVKELKAAGYDIDTNRIL
ncbi:MAG: nucleotide-binding protein [Bacteroidetes bacterium]|nr:nucleotide-binding protein [Bacteroidota bacterium]